MSTASEHPATILDSTGTYLDQIEACLSHLPDAIDAYGTDQRAFVASVDRLRCLESDCDATVRTLRALVGDGVDGTDTPVRLDALTRLYGLLEEIPNRAETFLREFRAARPTLSAATHETLQQIGADAARATGLLVVVVSRYVGEPTAGNDDTVAENVQLIGATESTCDDRRDAVLEAIFRERTTADALLVRELLSALDAVVDAIEDAAEQVLAMHSASLD